MPTTSPWSRTDALTAGVPMAVGALIMFVGWWEVSDRVTMGSQLSALNVAVLGLLLSGAGQALWFLRGRRAVRERRRALLVAGIGPRRPMLTANEEDRFTGGGRFYHRTDCAMVDNRNWTPGSRITHEGAGRVPCGLCSP